MLLAEGDRVIHEGVDLRIRSEVFLDEAVRLFAGDAQLLAQPIIRLSVDDAEIDGLGAAAHGRVHLILADIEDLRSRPGMDVAAMAERVDHLGLIGHVRQHAQLDL